MAPHTREMIGTIAGPFKIVERTNQKDSSKRIIYRCECVCGAFELGILSNLGKFQGHGLTCPGHPLKKGMETPDSGFTYFPDQPEHVEALAAWESARNPDQLKEDSEVNTVTDTATTETLTTESAPVVTTGETTTTTETPIVAETASTTEGAAIVTPVIAVATPAVSQKPPKAVVNKEQSTKMSAVLATRLKLTNYHTTSKKLTPPVKILGQDATSVVFAVDSTGKDLVMLHICLSSSDGKTKSIVSSMKKVPADDFSILTSTLAAMNVTWRSKDQPRVAA